MVAGARNRAHENVPTIHTREAGEALNISMKDAHFTVDALRSMSPRSQEAMRMCGCMPKDLVPRPKEFFQRDSQHQKVVEVRFQHHEKKRRNLLSQVRQQRNRLVDAGWDPHPDSPSSGYSSGVSTPRSQSSFSGRKKLRRELSASPLARSASPKSLKSGNRTRQKALIRSASAPRIQNVQSSRLEMERVRMERRRRRQEKEIENMITFELQTLRKRQQYEQKNAEVAKRSEADKRRRQQYLFELDKRRYQEDQRIAREKEAQMKRDRREAQRRFRQQEREAARQRQEEKDLQRRRFQQHVEQIEAEKRAEAATKAILDEQQRQIDEKTAQMNARDEQRRLRHEQEMRETRAARDRRARERRERNMNNYQTAQDLLNARRQAVYNKQMEDDRKLRQFHNRRMREHMQKQRDQAELDEKRRRSKALAEKRIRDRAQAIEDKNRRTEEWKRRLAEERAEEEAVKAEMKRLRQEEKLQNIERNRRREQYRRARLEEKVRADTEKARAVEREREAICAQRRHNETLNQIHKQQVLEAFGQITRSDTLSSLASQLDDGLSFEEVRKLKARRQARAQKKRDLELQAQVNFQDDNYNDHGTNTRGRNNRMNHSQSQPALRR